jgi:MFS family permease
MQQIMEKFSISANQFGYFAALYYYGYSSMQIPVAILLDKFKPRYVVFAFASLCGLATLIFNYTTSWYLACATRFFIGAGSAVGFLGVSKIISEWFDKDFYSKMLGFSFTLGFMGAIYGGKPIGLLVESYNWQNVSIALGITSVLIGLGALLFLKDKKNIKQEQQPPLKLADFKKLLNSPIIWLLAAANFLMVGSLQGFSDVWGVPYLMSAYGISKPDAAQIVSCVFVGMLFGGPLLAFSGKKLGNYSALIICALVMALSFVILFLSHNYNSWSLFFLCFVIGLMCCYQVLIFTAGSELVSKELLGITIAFLNCVNMLGGSFFHTSIGFIMDLLWSGGVSQDGFKEYALNSYQTSLTIIPVCSTLGAIILAVIAIKSRKSLPPDLEPQLATTNE